MSDEGSSVRARIGFFPLVRGESVLLDRAVGALVASTGTVSMENAGAQLVAGAGNVSIKNGGANLIAAGGNAMITQGGGIAVVAGSVDVHEGFLGVALSPSIKLGDEARVLATTPQAAAFGAALGTVVALALLVTRRRRPA